MEEIKSGPLKATPSPFQPTEEAGRAVVEDMVRDSFQWFLDLVEERRDISPDSVPGLREGRIFSGRQAHKHKLIDAIGGEDTAIAWLEKERKVKADLPVKDWKPKREGRLSLLQSIALLIGGITGGSFETFKEYLPESQGIARLGLDGLVSLWHPSSEDL